MPPDLPWDLSRTGKAMFPKGRERYAPGNKRGIYALGDMAGYAVGGAVGAGLPVDPRRPLPRPPDARQIVPKPVRTPPRVAAAIPSAPTTPQPAPVPEPPEPPTQAPAQPWQVGGPAPAGGAPDPSASHLLPAVKTAIESSASVIGNIAQTAAAVGTFGAAGLAGAAGGGMGGPSIAGAIQQFGKIAVGVANVGASLLVGSVPGSFGDPNLPAYGETQRPAQNVPHTAADNRRVYNINGVDSRHIVDDLRLKDAQDQQALLATSRG
jgi:hypothetical protein